MQLVVGMQRGRPLELLFCQPLMVGDSGTWWNDTLCKLKYPAIHRSKCHCAHHKSHMYYAGITFGSAREEPAAYCMRVLSVCVCTYANTGQDCLYELFRAVTFVEIREVAGKSRSWAI